MTDGFLDAYNQTFLDAITAQSPRKTQPAKITTPLLPHQLAIIHKMEEIENRITGGWKIDEDGTEAFGNYAFLGESVGVGKSLMVLGHIASSSTYNSTSHVYNRTGSFFTIKKKAPFHTNLNLIIVPHTIYRQWHDYITNQTTLKFHGISTQKDALNKDMKEKLESCDLILVTNTMLHLVSASQLNLKYNRIFIDEADSIFITYLPDSYNFIWFVTATWTNMLFKTRYLENTTIDNYCLKPYVHEEMKKSLLAIKTSQQHHYNGYVYINPYIRSHYLYSLYDTGNDFRFKLLVKCASEFIKQSTEIPEPTETIIRCKGIASQKLVQDFIPEEVNQMLHAGDVEGALEKLGVRGENPENLIEAVKLAKKKELDKLDADLKAIHIRIYAEEHTKQAAIKRVEEKIASLKEQMSNFEERVGNYKDESCGICYDNPIAPALTPCCSQIFCTECVVKSVKKFKGCPMCRHTPFSIKNMHYLVEGGAEGESEENTFVKEGEGEGKGEPVIYKKDEMLIKILTENPQGKFLVFSRYDNPFSTIEKRIEKEGITVNQLKGTKNTITSRIKKFSEGKIKALLLNSDYAGAGLNIVATTHIILWHAMTLEEEKQIIGRALRLGRKETVQVIKLINEGEA